MGMQLSRDTEIIARHEGRGMLVVGDMRVMRSSGCGMLETGNAYRS